MTTVAVRLRIARPPAGSLAEKIPREIKARYTIDDPRLHEASHGRSYERGAGVWGQFFHSQNCAALPWANPEEGRCPGRSAAANMRRGGVALPDPRGRCLSTARRVQRTLTAIVAADVAAV
jgi:hypothetical protein